LNHALIAVFVIAFVGVLAVILIPPSSINRALIELMNSKPSAKP